ncbi:MAG TPA: response regulator [Thermodesulfobacteriota bacterium]|nr:response regulator [Thermodesulfobacteriota bacterium]
MFRVLVVEDNAIFRQLVVEMLQDFPSLNIQEASSGEEALKKFKAQRPDLMFVDLELGGENGFILIERVRELDSKVIIVVLTSFDLPEYKELALRLKVDSFLTKGISTQEDIYGVVRSLADPGRNKKRVFGSRGELLGFMEEALVHAKSGDIVLGIMSFTFFDMPNMLFPIPWSAFSLNEKKQLTLSVDKEKLKHAPGFERDQRPDFGSGHLGKKVYLYYGYKPFWDDEDDRLAPMAFEEEAFTVKQGTC